MCGCVVQDGQTFLMIACQLGNYQIIRHVLDEPSVDVNAVDNVILHCDCDFPCYFALYWKQRYSCLEATVSLRPKF